MDSSKAESMNAPKPVPHIIFYGCGEIVTVAYVTLLGSWLAKLQATVAQDPPALGYLH